MSNDWLRELVSKMNKTSPQSIKDINDVYDYKDEHPQGKKDSLFVACGQCNGITSFSTYMMRN